MILNEDSYAAANIMQKAVSDLWNDITDCLFLEGKKCMYFTNGTHKLFSSRE